MEALIDTRQIKPEVEKKVSLMTFLDGHNLTANSVLLPYFRYLVTVCDGVWVVGGTARDIIDYTKPPHPDISHVDHVIRSLETTSNISDLSYLRQDFTKAHQLKEDQRRLKCDLDIMIAPHSYAIVDSLDPLYIFCTGLIDNLGLDFRYKPDGISFSTKEKTDRLKIDITLDVPSPFNSRWGNRLTFDDLRLPVDSELNVCISPNLLETDIPLRIVGSISDLKDAPSTEVSKRKAIRFLVQSLIEKNGKRVEIIFGNNDDEMSDTLEWLLRSLAYVIVDRDNNQKLYYKFLYAVLNWQNFDPTIQFVITNAFKLAGLVEAELDTPNA